MLGALIINFIFYILQVIFFGPIFINLVISDLNWLIDLIQVKQSVFKESSDGSFLFMKNFLYWYPQNLILLGALSYLVRILIVSVFVYITFQIEKLFTALNGKKLFTAKNVNRLRRISQSIMIIVIVKAISSLTIEFSWLLFLILLFIISEIYKYGVDLEIDKELTI